MKPQYEDKSTFQSGISEKVPISPEYNDSSSETEYDGEGLGDVSNLVNQVAHVATDPAGVNKLVNQAVNVIKYPASKLLNQVVEVIKHPEDILRHLAPVKGSGLANEENDACMEDAEKEGEENDACMEDAEKNDEEDEIEGENDDIEDEWMQPDAKVPKLEDSPCFNDFQQADHHIPSRIPETMKKYPQRECKGCRKRGIRHDTRYFCKSCPDNPALCNGCFSEYHERLVL